ncbi:unnamed protein product [Prunus armeniaca]
MPDVTESSSSTPIVMVHIESSTNLPMRFKLNGSNNEIWALMIELHATIQGKLGCPTGDANAPDSQDLQSGKWKIADAIVKSWMLQTMKPSLLNMFYTLPIAKEIWNVVNEMFFDGSDISQLYELSCKATCLKKKGCLIMCMIFLAGLDDTYDKEKEQRHLKKEQLHDKAHVAVAATSVGDVTTGHSLLTTTPSPPTLTVISSTLKPPPPSNFGKAFHASHDTSWIIDP